MNEELRARIESLEAERQRPIPPRPYVGISKSDLQELLDEVSPETQFNKGLS